MFTVFKLSPKDGVFELDFALLQQSLPEGMKVKSRDDGTYLEVVTLKAEDVTAQYLVDRELDRIYFLTRVRLKAEICTKVVTSTINIVWGDRRNLSSTIKKQNWSYELAIQLRLWAIANALIDPLVKIILLFQIIELACPLKTDYPLYTDSTVPPDPRTECKLLRHLVVHAGEVTGTELKNYCDYLGLPRLMLDRTDSQHVAIFAAKVTVVEREARSLIENRL